MNKFKYANKDIHIFAINDNIYLNLREIYKILKISNYQQYFKSISKEHTRLLSYSKANKNVFDELNYNRKQSVYLVDLQWVLDNSLNVNNKFRSTLIKAGSQEDEVSKDKAIIGVPEKVISELDTHLGKIFNYKSNDIRTVILDSELWFLASDITRILNYRNVSDALYKHVEKDDLKSLSPKVYRDSLTTFWNNENDYRNKSIINISGLFSLIMGSQMEEAKDFKHWVTHEVLGSIYKTGSYIDPTLQKKQPTALVLENQKLKEEVVSLKDENLKLLNESNETLRKYAKILEEGRNKQLQVNEINNSDINHLSNNDNSKYQLSFYAKGRTVYLSEFAKAFSELHNVSLGRNSLFKFLRDHKIFRGKRSPKYNQPTKQYEDKGYFKVTDSKTGDYKVTKLTYNGQVWLDKFLQGNRKLSKYLN
jgi:prophage antirepressor-like protein/phage antirepressor YoqD-like protein